MQNFRLIQCVYYLKCRMQRCYLWLGITVDNVSNDLWNIVHKYLGEYCVDTKDFFINWTIFSLEALRFIKRGYWDISTLNDTTSSFFQMLYNGECFPKEVSKILLGCYHHHKYILIFQELQENNLCRLCRIFLQVCRSKKAGVAGSVEVF